MGGLGRVAPGVALAAALGLCATADERGCFFSHGLRPVPGVFEDHATDGGCAPSAARRRLARTGSPIRCAPSNRCDHERAPCSRASDNVWCECRRADVEVLELEDGTTQYTVVRGACSCQSDTLCISPLASVILLFTVISVGTAVVAACCSRNSFCRGDRNRSAAADRHQQGEVELPEFGFEYDPDNLPAEFYHPPADGQPALGIPVQPSSLAGRGVPPVVVAHAAPIAAPLVASPRSETPPPYAEEAPSILPGGSTGAPSHLNTDEDGEGEDEEEREEEPPVVLTNESFACSLDGCGPQESTTSVVVETQGPSESAEAPTATEAVASETGGDDVLDMLLGDRYRSLPEVNPTLETFGRG